MKKFIIITSLLISVLLVTGCQKKDPAQTEPANKPKIAAAVPVKVQTIAQSRQINQQLTYPGTVAYDQEITVESQTSGTIRSMTFDLNKKVYAGQTLVIIDDTGGHLDPSNKYDYQSGEIQQLELAVEQAEESLHLAKKNYQALKNYTNKSAKESAEIQYDHAKVALRSALDRHQVLSPISGTITDRSVAVGDSVAVGTPIATISQTGKVIVKFYVNQDELPDFQLQQTIQAVDGDNQQFSLVVSNISTTADSASKRYLIEAIPADRQNLLSGTLVTVKVNLKQTLADENSLILPLSAITIDQNENYLFIDADGQAKKITVSVNKIQGETAEIRLNLPETTAIVIDGNKLLKDGDMLDIQ